MTNHHHCRQASLGHTHGHVSLHSPTGKDTGLPGRIPQKSRRSAVSVVTRASGTGSRPAVKSLLTDVADGYAGRTHR